MSKQFTHDPLRGFLFAFIGMALLSCNFITVKYGLLDKHGGFNPETLTVVWMGAATVFTTIWLLMRRQLPQVRQSGANLRWLLLLGGVNAFCQLVSWQGLQRLDPSFAAFLGRFAPIMAILLGAFVLREKLRMGEWLAIGVVLCGGLLCTLAPGTTIHRAEWIGIVLSLIGCFLSAMQWPVAKHCGNTLSGLVLNFYRVSVASVVVFVYAAATHTLDFSQARADQWAVTLLGAFAGPFLSYIFIFRSYRYWDMSRSAVVWTLQPLVVLPMALLVFGTTVTGWKLIGGLIILGGTIVLAILHRKIEEDPVEALAENTR